VEGTGEAVASGRRLGRGRDAFGIELVVAFVLHAASFAGFVTGGQGTETFAVESGFHGEGSLETPVVGRQAEHDLLFGGAARLKTVTVVLENGEEFLRRLVEQKVLVGAQAVDQVIAAGRGFAFRGARTGGFLGVAAIRVDARLAGGAIRGMHVGSTSMVEDAGVEGRAALCGRC